LQKEKEDMEEISNELELADEDEKIPYAARHNSWKEGTLKLDRYKIGDTFMLLPLTEVQDLLASSTSKIEASVSGLESKLNVVQEEMKGLKVQLYARFGKSINLET